jgi:ElaA protein
MIEWSYKKFDSLDLTELYDVLKLRASVFVVEQDCAYQDLDKKDDQATHVMGYFKKELIAYSRVFAPGVIEKTHAQIGRVVTQKESRGKGVGLSLMKRSISFCRNQFICEAIKISAQVYLKNFYNRLGFIEKGKVYLEDGIPHCAMYFYFDQKSFPTAP